MGLKIRDVNDDEPPLITGNAEVIINVSPEPENTNVINKLWTVVMEKVTDAIDCVIGETIANDKCDDCDGKNKKSPELENSVESKVQCNTNNERNLEQEIISDKVLNMPSPRLPEESQSITEHQAEDDRLAITVGDLVMVEDCPGHWSWASPFTVEAIDGDCAKLEMVGELVEIERLSKCPR